MPAPYIFSITNNPTETIEYFEKIKKTAYINHNLYIDIKEIKVITPETILYLLSFLEKTTKNRKIIIKGNVPADIKCKKIFLSSGFYDYVDSVYSTPKNIDILSIKSDNKIEGRIAKQIIDFACGKLELKRGAVTKAFYTTILECMGNTRQHAYASNKAKYAKWWLVAYYDDEHKCVYFSILDNGKGIPYTARKKFYEIFFPISDTKIIRSVLNGDFRTSTGLKYRGKGLPTINKFMKQNLIQDLMIVSNNAFYKADNEQEIILEKKFDGTLICWSFIQGE